MYRLLRLTLGNGGSGGSGGKSASNAFAFIVAAGSCSGGKAGSRGDAFKYI